MPISIPTIAIDTAGLRAVASALPPDGLALTRQAEVVVRTWIGLAEVYEAPESPVLVSALDPVRASARLHQARVDAVAPILDRFAAEVEDVVRQLDALRARAGSATGAAAARIEEEVLDLLAQVVTAEQAAGADIRAVTDEPPSKPGYAHAVDSLGGYVLLDQGDSWVGDDLLNTPLEAAVLDHFTRASGDDFVLSAADVAAADGDPIIRQIEEAIRFGGAGDGAKVATGDGAVPSTLAAVTLEGGRPGYAADVDFKQPATGRGENAFDGSLGRATAYFDTDGSFVGLSDLYDFSNRGPSVDLANLGGGLAEAQPFVVRGGTIEERPEISGRVVPDAGEAAGRLFDRVQRQDPGANEVTP
jgi:hypothetical protein